MSYSYFLVCMECKVGIHLGKTNHIQYSEADSKTYGFTALGHTEGEAWNPDRRGCSALQHFLMLHRTHELRVLADNVEKFAQDIAFPQSFPVHNKDEGGDPLYSRDVFFNTDVGCPDPEQELKSLPTELIEKLKTF